MGETRLPPPVCLGFLSILPNASALETAAVLCAEAWSPPGLETPWGWELSGNLGPVPRLPRPTIERDTDLCRQWAQSKCWPGPKDGYAQVLSA